MKQTIPAIIIAMLIILGAIIFAGNKTEVGKAGNINEPTKNIVSIADGKQIIEITTKGGYYPRKVLAKADMPTVLRFNTNSTYDCSSSVYIPSLKISKNLPASGSTDIDIGIQPAGKFQVTCAMGMYGFVVEFEG